MFHAEPSRHRRRRQRTALAALICALATAHGSLAQPSSDLPGAYYEDATRLLSQGDVAGGMIQLRNALQRDGGHVPSLLLFGETMLEEGDASAAAQLASEALLQGADPLLALPTLIGAYLELGAWSDLLREIQVEDASPALAADVLGARAQAYIALNRLTDAAVALRRCLGRDPRNIYGRLADVTLSLRRGRLGEAESKARELVEARPEDSRAWNSYASTLHAAGQVGPAIDAYRKAIARRADFIDARLALVSLYLDTGRDEEAARDLRYLEQTTTGDPRVSYFRALLAGRARDREARLAALTDAAGIIDGLDADMLSADPQLQMIGALTHFDLGAYERATALLRDYVASYPEDVGAVGLLATSLIATGDPAAAIQLLGPTRRRQSGNAEITALLSSAYAAAGQPENAAELLRSLPDAGEGSRASDRQLAMSLLDAGNMDAGTRLLEAVRRNNPEQRDLDLPLAVAYLRSNRFDEALELFESVLARSPDDLNLRNLHALALMGRGDTNAAERSFKELLAQDVGYQPARINLIRMYIDRGDVPAARAELEAALARDDEEPRLYFEASRLALLTGDTEEALRSAERAAQSAPEEIAFQRQLVRVHFARGDADAAEGAVRAAAYGNTTSMQARILLARTLAGVGKNKEAALTLAQLVRKADFDTSALFRLAMLQADLGEHDAALYTLSNALKGDPKHVPSQLAVARVLLAKGEIDAADDKARTMATQYPQDPRPRLILGAAELARGQAEAAAAEFREALALSNSTAAYLGLLDALRAAGDEKGQRALLENYVTGGGDDPLLLGRRIDLLLADGDWKRAAAELDRLLERFPQSVGALNNAAFVALQLGDPTRARALAHRALDLAPGDPAVNDTLGWILVQSGAAADGIGHLREAVTRRGDDPELRYHLAVALEQLDRIDEAAVELRRALGSADRFPGREDAEARLRRIDGDA